MSLFILLLRLVYVIRHVNYGYIQFTDGSLQLAGAFSVFVSAIFAGDGLFSVSCL